MPILPENKKRYPKNWNLISQFIRRIRARNKCEWCGVRNYSVGYRDKNGIFHGVSGNLYLDMIGQGLTEHGNPVTYKEARELCDEYNENRVDEPKTIVIVLTVAHVYDHRPENASFLNLAALCQKCHNDHDAKMRVRNAKIRRERNQLCLFS